METLAIVNALKRFRVYLQGISFTIVTDCNSLKKKQIHPRIATCALELGNYKYEIVHRDSGRMRHVDALSRNYEVMVVEANSFEQVLAVEQGRDPVIVKLRTELEEKPHKPFELQDGLVYRKSEKGKLLFYVLNSFENNVIRTCHDMGHFGVEKLIKLIKSSTGFRKCRKRSTNTLNRA